jgi:hypothetical protein
MVQDREGVGKVARASEQDLLDPAAHPLKQGEEVFVLATKQGDGSLITARIISISTGTVK